MDNSIVISVNTIPERDVMVKKIYKMLTKQKQRQFVIVQDRINRIRIYHFRKNLKILIKTYIVVVLPILLDFKPLESIHGTVEFKLDNTIDRLIKLTHKLQEFQGKRNIYGKDGAKKLKNSLMSLF